MATGFTYLRRRVLLIGGPITVAVIAGATLLASRLIRNEFERDAFQRLAAVAERASGMTEQYLGERLRDLRLLAEIPDVVDAAAAAGRRATRLGLDRLPTADLEARYAANRALSSDADLERFLREYRDATDFLEIFFTERNGLNVALTNPTSDFVQSDETWWRRAFADGEYQEDPAYDESAGAIALELAVRIEAPDGGTPLGVIKGVTDLLPMADFLDLSDERAGVAIEVVDSAGRVLISRDTTRLLELMDDVAAIPRAQETRTRAISIADGARELIATTPAAEGWWIVAREAGETAFAAVREIQRIIYVGAGAALILVLILIVWVTDWLTRHVTEPVESAGTVASRVADGDLSVTVRSEETSSAEVAHLLTAVQAMVAALRQLVGQIRAAADESAAMAEEISASTEEMSASTQEMANTCQNLTTQATEQAEMIRGASEDANRILGITTQLAEGSRVAAERNASLRETAEEHRERLLQGGKDLTRLAEDLEQGAAEAKRLGDMSQEIEKFVAQARAIAAQTNMLALNAAIEASRAGGGEGRGFAVVADEVRKLAVQAGRAAETTSKTVNSVLQTVQENQTRLTRLAEASASVRAVAESAAGGLQEVAGTAAETSAWTEEISTAAADVRRVVEEITKRLDAAAQGTESVVAAAEEIAASAQEQSASTEEIASSAAQLAEAADRLTAAVQSFRLLESGAPKPGPEQSAA